MRKFPVATLALAALLLSGCVQDAPNPAVSPSPSATPVFASDEDALAAAEAAYREYQAVVDRSLATYDTSRLSEVATGDALQAAIESIADFKSEGRKLVGTSSIDTVSLAQAGGLLVADREEPIQLYGCLDVSNTDVVDANGSSVVPTTRTLRVPMLISMVWNDATSLLVSDADIWDGDDFCG